MLRINVAADPDYYLRAAQELDSVGAWDGKLADRLGLDGTDLDAYRMLAKNRTPEGERLTPRDHAERRAVYDLTFSEPKSVSIMEQIAGDERIAWARESSLREVMREVVEPLATTRERTLTGSRWVTTGNLAWIDFRHKLSRPVYDVPDPGGHTHVVIPNATDLNGKRRALEIRPIKEAAPLIQAAWHASFASKLRELGYGIRPTKDAFEIEGVSDAVIRKFSRRSELIELEARRRSIKSPKGKAALGALTRERKQERPSLARLHSEWLQRLDHTELAGLKRTLRDAVYGHGKDEPTNGKRTLQSALASFGKAFRERSREGVAHDHLAETLDRLLTRVSAVPEQTLLTETLKAGVGETTLGALRRELEAAKVLRATIDGVPYVSTHEAMRKEKEILDHAASGGITIRRLKAGEEHGFAVRDPGFEQLHKLVSQRPDSPIELFGPLRDYRKSERGKPLVFLEDLGGLPTGQARPGAKLVEKALKVGNAVRAKVRKHLDRVRRIKAREQTHDVERQRTITRQPQPGIGR